MFVFSNLAISLDGKICTKDRPNFPLGTARDHQEMLALRKQADGILIGASTLRTLRCPIYTGTRTHRPFNIILSSSLKGISPNWSFFTHQSLNRILILGNQAPSTKIRLFKKSSQILILKKPSKRNPIAIQILQMLEAQGIKKLLVEGGGSVMWEFVAHNLIDQYHVTLTPKIVGGKDSPTLVDGLGFRTNNILSLKLKNSKVVGEELFLTYSRAR